MNPQRLPATNMTANKTVLWIDPHLEYRSPSTKHLLYALPRLRAAGWKIEVWCLRSDASPDEVSHTFLPAPNWLGPFELFYFTMAVNLYGLWRIVARRPITAAVIHASCGTYFGAQLISVHFVNAIWIVKQCQLGIHSFKQFAGLCFSLCGAVIERVAWWSPSLRKILAVSESIAEEVRQRSPEDRVIEVLPNSYDETRFTPAARELRRAPAREELGLGATDTVFAFLSAGHYERKGFWLAADALAVVRSEDRRADLKFLVIGGSDSALAQLRSQLQKRHPDFRDWIVFAGQQSRVENYLAAADAFLFPTHFETFGLAEVEAAAMGIPLLITRHHGSEMFLKEGFNGLALESDPELIAATIRNFLSLGASAFHRWIGRTITRDEYASALLREYDDYLCAFPGDPSPKISENRRE